MRHRPTTAKREKKAGAKSAPAPARPRRWKPAVFLPFLAAAILFLCLVHYHWSQVGDDSFIYFRYARNLAEGRGPVWNPGDPPVEGFSSPLWLAILAAGGVLGADIPAWSRAAGALLAGVALVGVATLARRVGARPFLAGLACLIATGVSGLHYWAAGGLETALIAATMTWTCAGLAGGSIWLWAIPTALVGLSRPEGPLLALASVLLLVVSRGREALKPLPIAFALGPVAGYFVFRLAYYGVLLPNTYYAKATGPIVERLQAGMPYLSWSIPACAAAASGAWFLEYKTRGRAFAVLGLVALLLALVAGGGGDWMFEHRLLVPALLPLIGVCAGLHAGRRSWPGAVLAAAAVAAVVPLLVPLSVLKGALTGSTLSPLLRQEGQMTVVSADVAKWIGGHYAPGTLIAVNHAGAVPYYLMEYPAIDMTGLNDAHIARMTEGGLHHKFDPAYVLSRRPGLIVLNSKVMPGTGGKWYHTGYWRGETALVREPDFGKLYRPVEKYWEWGWIYDGKPQRRYILVFEQKEQPGTQENRGVD